MKGITHFLTGLALASFFPDVVKAAEAGSLLPVLGGIGGLLPDTLDFKFVQFWENYDIEIDPGPEPNAKDIADTFVFALKKAFDTSEIVHLRTHTIQLGAHSWRRYTVEFVPEENEIHVSIGPVVSTSKKPSAECDVGVLQTCLRKIPFPIKIDYQQRFDIDIFAGPSFLFKRDRESVNVSFLNWHRRWTHSIFSALIVGLSCFLITGLLLNWLSAIWAGLLCGLGYTAHILMDQCGFLGSSIWWPLSRKRMLGWGLFHSNDALPNVMSVSLSLLVIFYNLDRFAPSSYLPKVLYPILALGIPFIVALASALHRYQRRTEIS